MKLNLRNLWIKLKAEIVQPVDYDECVCNEILPKNFFVDGGKCAKCGFQMYESKPKVK